MLIRDVTTSVGAERLAEVFGPLPYGFVLDSALPARGLGRFSICGAEPFLVLRAFTSGCELRHADGRVETSTQEPLELLRQLMRRYSVQRPSGAEWELESLPFIGGAVGFVSYEYGAALEGVRPPAELDSQLPLLEFGLYDAALLWDHQTGRARVVGLEVAGRDPELLCERLAQRLRQEAPEVREPGPVERDAEPQGARSDFTRTEYLAAVERVRSYIAAGDVYQVNLSQRFSLPWRGSPTRLYAELRRRSPAPYAVYLNFGYTRVFGSSPERFLLVRDGRVSTRPIKGTRPRGSDPETDARLRAELEGSEKDRAELLMIVDLERNDLGRVCETGSVRVDELWTLEAHPTVWHLVAEVSGRLTPGRDLVDLLRATLPGGSITGAPKVRAMQIIAELEPVPRGLYTGAMGYLGFDGQAELNIAIRTMVCAGGRLSYHVGGGITWDSEPAAEYEETLVKGRAMAASLVNFP